MSYLFTATNSDYLTNSAATFAADGSDLTIAAWVRVSGNPTQVGGVAALGHTLDSTSDTIGTAITTTSKLRAYCIAGSGDNADITTPTVDANSWALFVVTARFVTTGHRIIPYIYPTGGTLTAGTETATDRTQSPWHDQIFIGRGQSTTTANYLTGYIAEVSVWDKALDSTEVTGLTTKTANKMALDQSITGNLKGYFKLYNGLTSDTTYGGNYTLTASGTPSAETGVHPTLTDVGSSIAVPIFTNQYSY